LSICPSAMVELGPWVHRRTGCIKHINVDAGTVEEEYAQRLSLGSEEPFLFDGGSRSWVIAKILRDISGFKIQVQDCQSQ
jgi:hypothetical protein